MGEERERGNSDEKGKRIGKESGKMRRKRRGGGEV